MKFTLIELLWYFAATQTMPPYTHIQRQVHTSIQVTHKQFVNLNRYPSLHYAKNFNQIFYIVTNYSNTRLLSIFHRFFRVGGDLRVTQ